MAKVAHSDEDQRCCQVVAHPVQPHKRLNRLAVAVEHLLTEKLV